MASGAIFLVSGIRFCTSATVMLGLPFKYRLRGRFRVCLSILGTVLHRLCQTTGRPEILKPEFVAPERLDLERPVFRSGTAPPFG